MTTERTEKIEVRINPELKGLIHKAATANRQTISAYVLQAVLERMYGLKSKTISQDKGGEV